MLDRITNTLNFQSEALVLRSERQRLIASNIANADTPGYQARDFDFASALRDATGTGSVTGRLQTTHGAHIPVPTLGASGDPLRHALNSQSSLDNNTVDMDRERASFADNTVKYEATLRFVNGQMKTLTDAIKGQ
ncbi:flagellar basal-body rod protein FlgB [Sphaerotilus hippei]|uniref:Flagellar basal body rod protein FlgB n=1 Tax=Sphaerotilus hippei TaxID=744406 RepID=A0A318GVW3_9BURK|nr:flagellar basal body rod protein FlgB [Sphaerotilus hippei]PXW93701.1 flagellar basal-body rod protein FlgB [Sphaerotilus hippei]